MIGARLTGNRGFALIELLTAIVILSMGIAASLQVFTGAKHASLNAQRNEMAISIAQREMEKLKSLKYSEMTLSSAPSLCDSDGSGRPCEKAFYWNNVNWLRQSSTLTEIIAGPPNTAAGKINPGPDPMTVKSGGQSVKFTVWRYVTWRNEKCPTTAPCGAVDGSGNATLAAIVDTKRLVVAVVPDKGIRPGAVPKPVWISSVAIDPNYGAPTVDKNPPPVPVTQTRTYHLYNKLCSASDTSTPPYTAPTTHNATHDTSAVGNSVTTSKCSNATNNRPDLMGTTKPTQTTPTDYPFYFSNDTGDPFPNGAGSPGGLRLPQTSPDVECPRSYAATAPTKNVHTWVTPPMAALTRLKGALTLNFYAVHQGTSDADEHLCLTAARRANTNGADTQTLLGVAQSNSACKQSIAAWSGSSASIDVYSCSFNLDDAAGSVDSADGARYWDFNSGMRLSLTLSVASDSSQPLFLLYDHPSYASNLQIGACTNPTGATCK